MGAIFLMFLPFFILWCGGEDKKQVMESKDENDGLMKHLEQADTIVVGTYLIITSLAFLFLVYFFRDVFDFFYFTSFSLIEAMSNSFGDYVSASKLDTSILSLANLLDTSSPLYGVFKSGIFFEDPAASIFVVCFLFVYLTVLQLFVYMKRMYSIIRNKEKLGAAV